MNKKCRQTDRQLASQSNRQVGMSRVTDRLNLDIHKLTRQSAKSTDTHTKVFVATEFELSTDKWKVSQQVSVSRDKTDRQTDIVEYPG